MTATRRMRSPGFLDDYGLMIAEGLHARAGCGPRIGAVLSEEALIVLAAFGACGLLVLGVLELLWPTRSKHPVRERPPAPPAPAQRAHRQSALVRHGRGRPSAVRRTPPLALSPMPL